MSERGYSISKTSFLKFEQCEKAFFLYKHHPYLRDKITVDKQLTFKRGHDVGFFAQQLFPGGIDVSKGAKGSAEGSELTRKLIEEQAPVIYEATFVFNGVLIMADILVLENGCYTAYEVKSSMKVSETYLKDAYLQYYVLKNSLPSFEDLFLVTLNPDYVRGDEIEPKKLFRKRSVKLKAEENAAYFAHQIQAAHLTLEQNSIPNTPIGKHCFRPYQCDYFGTCWKGDVHEKSIFNLPYIDKGQLFEWYNEGIKSMEQLPEQKIEKEEARKIRRSLLSREPLVDRQKIRDFLLQVQQPFAAMDMEIWSAAIPQLKGTKPFEQVPFLVCFYDGQNATHFFADYTNGDERKSFAESLLRLSSGYATILAYDKTMEVNVINSLMHRFPDLAGGLGELKSKLVDVFEIFLGLSYYHPDFRNNFSLKAVSSVLLNDVQYTKITSGLEAMSYFEQYRQTAEAPEKEQLKAGLVDYCVTDTRATLKLVDFLMEAGK